MDQKGEDWLRQASGGRMEPITKATDSTKAWFVELNGASYFAKLYPTDLLASWGQVERAISGANLHPAIVRLAKVVEVADGAIYVYERIPGMNLGESEARKLFARLPLAERVAAVLAVVGALGSICEKGFSVVDWYEGNMLYDFEAQRIWLFDWELCRPASRFILEMQSNYGSSRLMAPEEFVKGSVIDEKTLVFNLGRYAMLSLPELAPTEWAAVLAKATYPSKAGRFVSIQSFLKEIVKIL